MSTRRREWVGKGAKRLMELVPPPFGQVPPVAGYTSWYDADDLSTFTLAGECIVTAWADKGSGGNNLSPASQLLSPILTRHHTLFRGRRACRFVGPNTSNGTVLGSSASASDITQTSFVVAVAESIAADGSLLGSSADGGNQFRVATTGALSTVKADTALLGSQGNASVTVGTPFVAVQAISASDVTHYLNGTSETDAHAQTFTAARTLQVGNCTTVGSGNAAFTGWIAEIIIYDTTLNSSDVATVTAWLRSKWDV